jgi:putative spermidine/putrescine transport system permease protein
MLLVAPLVLLLGAIFIVPIARIFWIALSEPRLGLHQFRAFFDDPAATRALVTTLRISAIVTVLGLAIGAIVAWELATTRSTIKRALLWSAVLFPLWTSLIVRNYAFTILLQRRGVLNETLQVLGIVDQPLGIMYTNTAVTIGMLYTMLPYAILPLYASFVAIDQNLIRAAESLGASRPRAIASVVVPLALPSVLASGAIVFVVSVGFYITPILLGGPQAQFVATLVDRQIFNLYDFPAGAATSAVLFIAAIAVIGMAWRVVGFERLRRAVA